MRNALSAEKKRITEEWYQTINDYNPIDGVNYSWILDYAKFRLEWVLEKTRYVEEKSQALLRLVLVVSAGSWAVFSVILGTQKSVSVSAAFFTVAALACLLISAYFTIQAAAPVGHIYPRGEDKAILYANFYKNDEAAKGRFALLLGDSSEQERLLTIEKGGQVNRGIVFVFAAAISFSLALFVQVFR